MKTATDETCAEIKQELSRMENRNLREMEEDELTGTMKTGTDKTCAEDEQKL